MIHGDRDLKPTPCRPPYAQTSSQLLGSWASRFPRACKPAGADEQEEKLDRPSISVNQTVRKENLTFALDEASIWGGLNHGRPETVRYA